MLKQLNLSLQFALQSRTTPQKPASPNAAPLSATRHRTALPRHLVAKWIRHALQVDADITVRIVDAIEGQALNREYRHKHYATNVLTFTYASAPVVMPAVMTTQMPSLMHEREPAPGASQPIQADLVLCAPVVAREAREQKKTLQAHYAHLLVHGTLHAQGFDHETSRKDAVAMEQLEVAILARMGFKNPY